MIKVNLKSILIERGITQAELARRTDLKQSQISIIVRDTNESINKTHLDKIMKALGITDISEIIEYVAD